MRSCMRKKLPKEEKEERAGGRLFARQGSSSLFPFTVVSPLSPSPPSLSKQLNKSFFLLSLLLFSVQVSHSLRRWLRPSSSSTSNAFFSPSPAVPLFSGESIPPLRQRYAVRLPLPSDFPCYSTLSLWCFLSFRCRPRGVEMERREKDASPATAHSTRCLGRCDRYPSPCTEGTNMGDCPRRRRPLLFWSSPVSSFSPLLPLAFSSTSSSLPLPTYPFLLHAPPPPNISHLLAKKEWKGW